MKSVEQLVRKDVRQLEPYVCARDLCKQAEQFMDANENAFGTTVEFEDVPLNRYPDSDLLELKQTLAEYIGGIAENNVLVGNGSDEIIDLAIRTFAEKGDNVVCIVPGYSMFEVCAQISGVHVRRVLVEKDFQPNVEKVLAACDGRTKLIMLVTPNSPLGNIVEPARILDLLEKSGAIVFVDEAYGEFAGSSWARETANYGNLLVSKTLSKAWGLAALRVGYAVACPFIIESMRKIKPPYNVSAISNYLALRALGNRDRMELYVREMKEEKEVLEAELKKMGFEVFDTVTNFSVFRVPGQVSSKEVQRKIAGKGIIVRDRSPLPFLENCIRVTVGTRKENRRFLSALERAMTL